MAIMTDKQIKRRMERALKQDQTIKRKVEKQKEKELYSEKWYKDEVKKNKELLEEVAPLEVVEDKDKKETRIKNGLPTFFECFDINTLFNPIELFKDNNGKVKKAKLEDYKFGEKLYEPILTKLTLSCYKDDELKEIYDKLYGNDDYYNDLIQKRKDLENRLRENKKQRQIAEKDKEAFDIDLTEALEKEKEQIEKLIEEYEELGVTRSDVDSIQDNEVPSIENNDIWSRLGQFRSNFFINISKHFQRYVPIYDKHVCTCCGKPKDLNEYYINYNVANLSRLDPFGNVRLNVCKDCAEKLFNYYYLNDSYQSIEIAMKKFCASLNIYYNEKIVIQAIRNYGVHEHEYHFIKEYFDLLYIDESNIEKNFLDSEFLLGAFVKEVEVIETPDEILKQEEPFIWSKEDIRNKNQVIRMIGYDPFEYQTDKNRAILYSDLLNMLEAGMENDMVKVQAAIQIVLSYFRIREMNEEEYIMRKNNASLADLKSMGELKAKELTAISKFSQDNGFSERYATAKAKGENTFTGIMKKMLEDKFEDSIANKFDIDTSVTIQQAADASIGAIFKQLNMSTAEYGIIMGKQLKEITDLRKENELLVEQIRKFKVNEKREELTDKAKEEGVYYNDEIEEDEEEDDEL